MKDLSQKPDYETMWKVECELNKELQEQNKKVNELIVKIFEQDRFNEDYFDLELINEVRVHIENN